MAENKNLSLHRKSDDLVSIHFTAGHISSIAISLRYKFSNATITVSPLPRSSIDPSALCAPPQAQRQIPGRSQSLLFLISKSSHDYSSIPGMAFQFQREDHEFPINTTAHSHKSLDRVSEFLREQKPVILIILFLFLFISPWFHLVLLAECHLDTTARRTGPLWASVGSGLSNEAYHQDALCRSEHVVAQNPQSRDEDLFAAQCLPRVSDLVRSRRRSSWSLLLSTRLQRATQKCICQHRRKERLLVGGSE